jgi:hypothetical protein
MRERQTRERVESVVAQLSDNEVIHRPLRLPPVVRYSLSSASYTNKKEGDGGHTVLGERLLVEAVT